VDARLQFHEPSYNIYWLFYQVVTILGYLWIQIFEIILYLHHEDTHSYFTRAAIPSVSSRSSSNFHSNTREHGLHLRLLTSENRNSIRELLNLDLPFHDGLQDGWTSGDSLLPSSDGWEALFKIDTFGDETRGIEHIVWEKSKVREREIITNHPFSIFEMSLENSHDAKDLVLIASDGRRDLLRVKIDEPMGLTVVRALATGLEEEPLINLRLFLKRLAHKSRLVLGIITIHQVEHDGVTLPDWEIVVVAIDESGNASVWIVIDVRRLLLLERVEVQELGLSIELEFFHEKDNLPNVRHVHSDVVEDQQRLGLRVG